MKAVVRKTTSIYGVAKVVVGESRIKVTLKSSPESDTFDGKEYRFDKDDAPECIRKSGTYLAAISGDEKTLYGLRPIRGTFKTKVKNIASRKDEPPAPKVKTGRYGPYQTFTVNLVILDHDDYEGMEIPVQFNYSKFIETDDELTSVEVGDKAGSPGERLLDFLEIAGVGDVQIPFSDNILPRLQKALLKAGVEFYTKLKDGWADSFLEIPNQKASDEDDPDDEPEDDDDDFDERLAEKMTLKPKVEDDDDLDEPVVVKKGGKNGKDTPPWDENDEPKAKKSRKSDPTDKFDDDDDE